MINKVKITLGAKFDYEEIVAHKPMPIPLLKRELEEYFDNRLVRLPYFHLKFFDEDTNKMLRLFLRRGCGFCSMQVWLLSGVCEADDYTEDVEERGLIRNWLNNNLIA